MNNVARALCQLSGGRIETFAFPPQSRPNGTRPENRAETRAAWRIRRIRTRYGNQAAVKLNRGKPQASPRSKA
jgi:hypothetical protein